MYKVSNDGEDSHLFCTCKKWFKSRFRIQGESMNAMDRECTVNTVSVAKRIGVRINVSIIESSIQVDKAGEKVDVKSGLDRRLCLLLSLRGWHSDQSLER